MFPSHGHQTAQLTGPTTELLCGFHTWRRAGSVLPEFEPTDTAVAVKS